ncbi:response regulator transcription factor [Actinomycetes bacterium M1A6_2h]
MIKVMIVDDDALVRLGLTDLLDDEADIEVVAQASDGVEAVAKASAHRIDVALVDVRMPRMNGIDAIPRLKALPYPPKVVTLTTFDIDQYVYESVAAGADGFLLKDTAPSKIVEAVRVVHSGSAILHPSAARALIDRYHHTDTTAATKARALIHSLTPRERDVLVLLANGDTNAEIAASLSMRESTVKSHVSRILTALGASNRVQAALISRDAAG